MSPEYKEIPVEQIKLSPFNTRGEVEEAEIANLAVTMKAGGGNDVPIKVRPIAGDQPYEVVYGERRIYALKLAGINVARCIVQEMTDAEVLLSQWMENEEHKNIPDYGKALKLEQMMDSLKVNQSELANKIGKTPAWISYHLSMLKLQTKLTGVNLFQLSEYQARAILAAPPEVAEKLIADINEQYKAEGTIPSNSEIDKMAFNLVEEKAEADAVKCDSCKQYNEGEDTCEQSDGECVYEKKEETIPFTYPEHVCAAPEGSTTCRICGRELTAPESVKKGIGPVCAEGNKQGSEIGKPVDNLPTSLPTQQPKEPTLEEKAFKELDELNSRFPNPSDGFMMGLLKDKLSIYRPDSDKLIKKYRNRVAKKEPVIITAPLTKLASVKEEDSKLHSYHIADIESFIQDIIADLCRNLSPGMLTFVEEALRRKLQ